MLNRRVRALLLKDLRLHGQGVALTQAAALALVWLVFALHPSDPERQVTLIFNVNFLLTSLWGEWLVSREKTKGTFAWLRTLPVADRDLVAAKFLSAALYCMVLWIVMSCAFAPFYFLEHAGLWLLLAMALVTFGGITLAARWRFSQKVGQTLPFALVLVLILILIAAERANSGWSAAVAEFIRSTEGRVAAGAALVAGYLFTAGATATWVRMSDTSQLLE